MQASRCIDYLDSRERNFDVVERQNLDSYSLFSSFDFVAIQTG